MCLPALPTSAGEACCTVCNFWFREARSAIVTIRETLNPLLGLLPNFPSELTDLINSMKGFIP